MALLRPDNWPVGWPLAALAAAAALYHAGGRARETRPSLSRSASFYAGIATLALAVGSPVDAYADRLFFVHMVQHVLLTMAAPPLLLLGRPWPRLLRPFPRGARRAAVGGLFRLARARRGAEWAASPLPAFVLFNGTLLGWHLPALYDLTLRSQAAHDLEHALFFGTALLFWRHLAPAGRARALSDPARAAYGAGGLAAGFVLAVVLALAPDAVYSAYAGLSSRPLGLSALGDQQLAAGIMWVPGSAPETIAVLAACYRWLDPGAARRRPLDLRPRET